MKNNILFGLVLVVSPLYVGAQTGIFDTADIIVVEGGLDCNGSAREVQIFVDMTGMTGKDGEPVGLNAVALSLSMSDPVFLAACRGADTSDWACFSTEKTLANFMGKAVLVGSFADPFAPATDYHVATFLYGGIEGELSVEVSHLESSFGSRIVPITGDGPGFIPYGSSGPVVIHLPPPFTFDLLTSVFFWGRDFPDYDLVAPSGPLDVLDLVKTVACSP